MRMLVVALMFLFSPAYGELIPLFAPNQESCPLNMDMSCGDTFVRVWVTGFDADNTIVGKLYVSVYCVNDPHTRSHWHNIRWDVFGNPLPIEEWDGVLPPAATGVRSPDIENPATNEIVYNQFFPTELGWQVQPLLKLPDHNGCYDICHR